MKPGMSTPARLLLCALAPSASVLPTLALGLSTWEDNLWARVCALFEDRLDVLLDRWGGFWSSSGIRDAPSGSSPESESKNDVIEEEDDEEAFEEQIENVLKELQTVKVNSRYVMR